MKRTVWKATKQGVTFLVTLAVVIASVLWLSNFFSRKIPASVQASAPSLWQGATPVAPGVEIFTIQLEQIPRYRAVVGTVQAVHAAEVGSRLMAQIGAVHVTAGKPVEKGDVLVELDDADLQARVRQAEAQLASSRAAAEQSRRDFQKQEQLFKSGATSEQEFLRYQTTNTETQAAANQAEHALSEAQTILSWTVIRSPIGGIVVDKMVEAGDLVRPGQALVRLYNRESMQLVASVPESLASQLVPGQPVNVKLDVLPKACVGMVSEVVPEAASQSRTFQVKVTGPCPPGVYSGMFGRLLIPTGQESQIRIPAAAVRAYGQLRQVMVTDAAVQQRRFVTLGEQMGDWVVVLSGLQPGEKIVASYGAASTATTQPLRDGI